MLSHLLLTISLKQQEQLRDENKKLSTTTTSTLLAPTSSDNRSTSTVTGTSSAVTSAAGTVRRPSSDSGLASDSRGISDSSASRTETLGTSSKQNRDSVSGTGSGTQAAGKTGFRLDMLGPLGEGVQVVLCSCSFYCYYYYFLQLCNYVIKLVETGVKLSLRSRTPCKWR